MYYSFPSRYSDSHRIELGSFLDVISGHGELSVSARTTAAQWSVVSGKMTQAISKIATACDKSARSVRLVAC